MRVKRLMFDCSFHAEKKGSLRSVSRKARKGAKGGFEIWEFISRRGRRGAGARFARVVHAKCAKEQRKIHELELNLFCSDPLLALYAIHQSIRKISL